MATRQPQTNKKVEHQLVIEGAHCASCVNKIETALSRVPGVDSAAMNLAQRTVSVIGSADNYALIKAIEQAGYSAKPARESTEDLLAENEKADWAYYQKLIRETWIALSLADIEKLFGRR